MILSILKKKTANATKQEKVENFGLVHRSIGTIAAGSLAA